MLLAPSAQALESPSPLLNKLHDQTFARQRAALHLALDELSLSGNFQHPPAQFWAIPLQRKLTFHKNHV